MIFLLAWALLGWIVALGIGAAINAAKGISQ